VDSCESLLEGIIASKKNNYDAIVVNQAADSQDGLEVLTTLRQNDVRSPLLFNDTSRREMQVFEQSNRRRYDLELETANSTLHSFLKSLEKNSSAVPEQLNYQQLHQIVDYSAVPVLVLNQYAAIVYANRIACDFLQFESPLELYNNSLNRIFPLKSALSGRRDIPHLISQHSANEQTFFWEVVDRNGNRKCVSVRANRLNQEGPVSTVLQFLIGNETAAVEVDNGQKEEIIRVLCSSRIMKAGLEMALAETPHFFEFEDSDPDSRSEDTFTGSTMFIHACSSFDGQEIEQLQRNLKLAGDRPGLVVALSAQNESVKAALKEGVRGIIVGEKELDSLNEAMQVVATGGLWMSPQLAVAAVSAETGGRVAKVDSKVLSQLTRRETEVLSMLAQGMKNHSIADDLGLSYRTVVTHVYNIYRKLNLSSRTEAIHLAIASGLVSVDKVESGE